MSWTPAQKQAYLDTIKMVDIKRLETPYTIDDYYTAGTKTAKKQWDKYWHGTPLKGPRYNKGLRRGIFNLDMSKPQYIIPQDESVILRDAETGELVGVMLRDFFPEEFTDLREEITRTCLKVIKNRRDDRREDPGQLCHFGYMAGSRHKPLIYLATSSQRLERAAQIEPKLNARAQGLVGIGWNMLRSRLPQEIIDDYKDLVAEQDLPRMDMMRKDKSFSFDIDGRKVRFETEGKGGVLELPPPSGIVAFNYARHTHNERNRNKWFISCTTTAPADPTRGGNFYLASYGIMLMPASNCVTSFRPTEYHDTTLYEMMQGPEKRDEYELRLDGGCNTVFTFEISKALKNANLNAKMVSRSGHQANTSKKRRHYSSDDESGSEYTP